MDSSKWHNKVCLVTGGSSGLGLSIARALAKCGARAIITARRAGPLAYAAEQIGAEAIPADVTSDYEVDRLRQTIADRYESLDLLCNCAGRSTRGMALDTTVAEYQELLEVNFLSTVRVTRAFAPLLLEHGGHVVNIASLAGKVAPRFLGAYPASKFAIAAYSQQLRLELAPEGLHVLLVCPGPIAREDSASRYAEQSADLPEAARQPAAGAKLRGIDPDWLAERIVTACERRTPELVVPWKVRLLLALASLSPKLGDWILLRSTSG